MTDVYLSIGGNLGDRLSNLRSCVGLLSERLAAPQKVSSVYLSEPWGFWHAKYFTNIVVKLQTALSPTAILLIINTIEQDLHRVRKGVGYSGRTIDIDILFYGRAEIQTSELTIPHPRFADRLFVLLPLAEIEPDIICPPHNKHIGTLLAECRDQSRIRRLTAPVDDRRLR